MYTDDILQALKKETSQDSFSNADYVETLNSWIIRSDNHAFKIRKPTQASGLELSTPEKRKDLCLREQIVNKTLAGKTYENVIPLKKEASANEGPENSENIVDYALKMKRLPEQRCLLYLLKKQDISSVEIEKIAGSIADFHNNTAPVKNTFNITKFQEKFEDIERCEFFIKDLLGPLYIELIKGSINTSKKIISSYRYFLQKRTNGGAIRDGHGNLSASNIFLEDNPIVTGREINNEHRAGDVLFDIARLGIDLDFFRYYKMEEGFLNHYLKSKGEENSNKIRVLYTYYKFYRTGLIIIKLLDRNTIFNIDKSHKLEITRYFELLNQYRMNLIKS